MAEFIFSKVPRFQNILLNTCRRVALKYENYYLRGILSSTFKKYSSSNLDLQKPYCNNFRWIYIKNWNYLGNKTISAVVSQSDVHFGFACLFFLRAHSGAQKKLCARKIGCDELNLSRPTTEFLKMFRTFKIVQKYHLSWRASDKQFNI